MDLDSLIAQFDGNPFAISRVMRQLRDTDFGRFQESALRAIASLPESSGIRFLATLLPLSEQVLEIVANPIAFDEPSARRIIEVLRRIDSQAEAKLLRLITANPGRPLPPQMIDRILDVVDALTEGPRLVPALMQIFRSANPYLRARLSLSIGKHHRNKDWIEDRMRDNDPRVRANTVEANWLQTDETAMTLFNTALRDTHHRVAGNGAVGLYYAGDVRALLVFGELLGSTDPTRQATGVWAVGHVQDTRFQAQVSALADCPDLIVHRSVVLTLGSLKRITEIRGEQPRPNRRDERGTRSLPDGDSRHAGGRARGHNVIDLAWAHIVESGRPRHAGAVRDRNGNAAQRSGQRRAAARRCRGREILPVRHRDRSCAEPVAGIRIRYIHHPRPARNVIRVGHRAAAGDHHRLLEVRFHLR